MEKRKELSQNKVNKVLSSDLITVHSKRMKCVSMSLISGSVIFVFLSNSTEITENELWDWSHNSLEPILSTDSSFGWVAHYNTRPFSLWHQHSDAQCLNASAFPFQSNRPPCEHSGCLPSLSMSCFMKMYPAEIWQCFHTIIYFLYSL